MARERLTGLDARQASIDEMLIEGRYEDTLQELEALTDVPEAACPANVYGDFWLKRALCLLLLKRRSECARLIARDRTRLEDRAPRHLALACAATDALGRDATLLRAATERFSQGLDWNQQGALQRLLAKLDDELIPGSIDLQEPLDNHNYAVTSYSLWSAGLAAMLGGAYQEAHDLLRASMDRYELGQMPGDVLWSWFDAIVALLMLDQQEHATELYEEFEDRASTSNPHFETAALEMLEAYRKRQVGGIRRAEELMAHKWAGFKESQYPAIFRAFELKITTLAGATTAVKPNATAVKERGRRHRVLICRPAVPDDLPQLVAMAQEVNLGNTRPDEKSILNQIQICHSTLAGEVAWEQGILYLVTELLTGEETRQVVGSCKLQKMAEGCWARLTHQRVAKTVADGRRRAQYDELIFDSSRSNALEFSGNVVLESYRRQGIGKFHGHARLLYLLTQTIPGVAYLYADLLTDSVNGLFPFYERIVRPLIGEDVDYDQADKLRYNDMSFYEDLLGRVGDNCEKCKSIGSPPVSIPVHIMPQEIRHHLGKVREQTIPAQKVLREFGFRETNKFDLLDAGQYMEIQFDELRRANIVRQLTAKRTDVAMTEADPSLAFAPARRAAREFFAVRAPARIQNNELLIATDLYRALELDRNGELVQVVVDRRGGDGNERP
jgi:arginine/ornithine N-succinyltransferase beta subunit